MKVNVAGAGAGKTTKMADRIMRYEIPDGKILFCISFTNAAADHIEEKIVEGLGEVPSNIKVSTIHSFLYQELIRPYYYFLYGKHFELLSVIELPTELGLKARKLSELEKSNILHFTKIPEKAKWVVYPKSNDKKHVKVMRQRVLSQFSNYCAAIFVDEAQDISEDISKILCALDKAGIDVILCGDPKQDVKGYGSFRKIIEGTENVTYISECHRCPQKHLNLSNMLATDLEQQVADKENAVGSIGIVFESDIDNIKGYIDDGDYGLRYISMKRQRFDTHDQQKNTKRFETLRNEVQQAINNKWQEQKNEMEIGRAAFCVTERMLDSFDILGDASQIISYWVKKGAFAKLTKQQYVQMISAFTEKGAQSEDAIVVNSIEIVKGLEASRCLFIVTPDLAPYLFRTKTADNKESHLLYVALTRSLEHLTILITREVEDAFTRKFVTDFFNECGVSNDS